MAEPLVIPRAEHPISRKQIDPDALKVLNRLHQHGHLAYLVGGSVRDLLLGRQPKDFDVGTSAHPGEIKKLFRNCWIIGRRFRLAHVRFGLKTIEVATFRRQVPPGTEVLEPLPAPPETPEAAPDEPRSRRDRDRPAHLMYRDNTFGTPEEDAFRRDFTLNALFYDIATFAILDYTGGLEDLRAGLIRCIGEPEERFVEDPVRMLRAVALAARLDFKIDRPVLAGIAEKRLELRHAAPARLVEELYKILRAGASQTTFRSMHETGLLESMAPDLQRRPPEALWRSLEALDAYRAQAGSPAALTNAILLGSLLVPLGFQAQAHPGDDAAVSIGVLPAGRKDVERLRQILYMQPRLRADVTAPARVRRRILHRTAFPEALTWMEIHDGLSQVAESWRTFAAESAAGRTPDEPPGPTEEPGPRKRRRRRRRRSRRAPS